MNQDIIAQVFQVFVIPVLGVLTVFIVRWLGAKADELKQTTNNDVLNKYIDLLTDTITTCVTATNQTYVDALKAEGKFDAKAQKAAFKKTYDAVLEILSEEAVKYITAAVGDFETYLTQKIEEEVHEAKNEELVVSRYR